MKKIVYLSNLMLLIITTNVYATNYIPEPYLGGQAGWGRIDEGKGYQQWADNQPARKTALGTFTAWRVFAGYNFVPFFSIEGGYTYYPENNYSNTLNDTINIKTYAIDLVGKIVLPLVIINESLHRFGIYAKGGGAYLNTKIDCTIAPNSQKQSNNAIRPTYGAGITFNFTDNIAMDASWTGIYGKNRINSYTNNATLVASNPTPSANLFTLGLYYKFTRI